MRVVLVCPGRGTYGKAELGTLARLHADKAALFAPWEAERAAQGQPGLAALDGAARFDAARHTAGDNASALIYAATLADVQDLRGVEVVAVTGNSMGWYSALAAAGALDGDAGFQLANGMGRRMQAALIGGQVVYPHMADDWRPAPARKAALLALAADIATRPGHALAPSIDLGGMLVLGGTEAGLAAFEAAVPAVGQFPLRLANHAAFHTALQAPVAAEGRAAFGTLPWRQPAVPLVDGRGALWWPRAVDPAALAGYTLGHQVVEPYDFTRAIAVAAREFAPDAFVVTGPGTTLGGAVAQALILAGWRGLQGREDFVRLQAARPLLIAMGRPEQRALVTRT
jgi:malonyl CoA-acyl carrier protein transacylase